MSHRKYGNLLTTDHANLLSANLLRLQHSWIMREMIADAEAFLFHHIVISGALLYTCFFPNSKRFFALWVEIAKLSTWIICNLENLFLIWSEELTFHDMTWKKKKREKKSNVTTIEKNNQKKHEEMKSSTIGRLTRWDSKGQISFLWRANEIKIRSSPPELHDEDDYEQASYEYFTVLPNGNEFFSLSLYVCVVYFVILCIFWAKYIITYILHSVQSSSSFRHGILC